MFWIALSPEYPSLSKLSMTNALYAYFFFSFSLCKIFGIPLPRNQALEDHSHTLRSSMLAAANERWGIKTQLFFLPFDIKGPEMHTYITMGGSGLRSILKCYLLMKTSFKVQWELVNVHAFGPRITKSHSKCQGLNHFPSHFHSVPVNNSTTLTELSSIEVI